MYNIPLCVKTGNLKSFNLIYNSYVEIVQEIWKLDKIVTCNPGSGYNGILIVDFLYIIQFLAKQITLYKKQLKSKTMPVRDINSAVCI